MAYRRSITINGKELKSPRFDRASDADKWYQDMLRQRHFARDGMAAPVNNQKTTDDFFYNTWFPHREKTYPMATWKADLQRYEKYIASSIGKVRISRVTQLQIRAILKAVVEKHKCSLPTRDRVRSLLSKIFNDAMNEEPPLRGDNPALNITFADARTGSKAPSYLKRHKDIEAFIAQAKKLGRNHHLYASIVLMTGLRKSEVIPLRWGDFDEHEGELRVDKHFEQASMRILPGTKAGSDESRDVGLPDSLIKLLKEQREKSDFQGEEDFILCNSKGELISPRKLHEIHEEIRIAAKVEVTPHGLRHSYGRMFVINGGSMKALQTILGHSNSTVTELYSELAGKEVKKYRNTVSFGEGDE